MSLAGAYCTNRDHSFDGTRRDVDGRCPKCEAERSSQDVEIGQWVKDIRHAIEYPDDTPGTAVVGLHALELLLRRFGLSRHGWAEDER